MSTTRRINRGRGHSYILDGDEVIGVTTVINEGIPKPGLIGWAAKTTAGYAVDHWDELNEMSLSERLTILLKARFEARDGAGERGTEVHLLAQRLAGGAEIDVPDPLLGHVDSYLRFVDEWQPKELITEATVINRRYRYMGTLDTIADLKDGLRWMLDYKTTASGVWPETALQLAAYRNAETYISASGDELDLPAVDRCGVVWLRADGYDLVPVDADDVSYKTFLYAQAIARWRSLPKEMVVGEAMQP